jgi:tyrosine-protein kinase Etk/Wzc
MEETDKVQRKLPNQEIDYFKIGKILLSRWYWIAASVALTVIISYIYLWYTPKTYATSGTLKIEEKKSEISDLTGGVVTNPDRGASQIQSIISVLKSRSLLLSAVKDLDYRISFYISGRVRISETYPQKPLSIDLIKFDSMNFYHDLISFKPLNKQSFYLSYKIDGKDVKRACDYNVPVVIGITSFTIKYPGAIDPTTIYLFKFNKPDDYVDRVRNGLQAAETAKYSNIIYVQETDQNPQFASDILNSIMNEYVIFDHDQKTQSATQMIDFIDSQLLFLSNEVKSSGNTIEKYEQKSKILDISTAATTTVGKAAELQSSTSILKIQLLALDQLRDQITKEKDDVNLNFNIDGSDIPGLQSAIGKLDNLVTERASLLKTFTYDSQPVQDVNQQILQIKATALNTIKAIYENIQRKMSYYNTQLSQVDQTISELPAAQRDLASLQRDFDVNDKVYSFLSEKKLDAQISRSGILPGATIIENAQPNFNAVSPDEHDIHRTAIIMGLAIGLGLIIVIRVINPYIYDKETVESLTTIPILGVIRKFPEPIDEDSTQILAISKPRSIFAESVRSVRTNLSFLASEKMSKVICVTSEVAGEGKSFIAVNLSSTLSLIDKKVILVAADLRRSKIHKTFNIKNDNGLSNYLANQCTIDDIINRSQQENLDIIVSGAVPPNPSELLHSTRMINLIDSLKLRYDIIMIDTAPIGLVSDAIPLIRFSDINVFVIRSGKSKFYAATVPQRIAQEFNLNNTVIILNAYAEDLLHSRHYTTKFTSEHSGGGYYYYSDYSGYNGSGYYVDPKDTKWWNINRWFKR